MSVERRACATRAAEIVGLVDKDHAAGRRRHQLVHLLLRLAEVLALQVERALVLELIRDQHALGAQELGEHPRERRLARARVAHEDVRAHLGGGAARVELAVLLDRREARGELQEVLLQVLALEELRHVLLHLLQQRRCLGGSAGRARVEADVCQDDLARVATRGHRHLDPPHERVDRARVAKVGLDPLLDEQVERGLAHAALRPAQPGGGRRAVQQLLELLIAEVLEEEGRLGREAPLEAGVGLAQHLEHLFVVAEHQHGDVLSRRVHHLRDDRVDRASAEAAALPETIGLVDDEHLALADLEHARSLLLGAAHLGIDQIRRRARLDRAVRQVVEPLQDAAVDLGDRGLARAGVAQEEPIERQQVRLLTGELTVVVDHRELHERVDLLLDRREADLLVEFGQSRLMNRGEGRMSGITN